MTKVNIYLPLRNAFFRELDTFEWLALFNCFFEMLSRF